MIQNWTVKTKQVKKKAAGFINYINYLKNASAGSHEFTNIVVLDDNARNIVEAIEERKRFRQANSLRGGGVSNYATSFVMSLPNDVKQPSHDEWHKIGRFAVKKLAEQLDIPYKKLLAHSHIVLHEETNGKHSHLNLVIGNVIDNQVEKRITQYAATHTVKQSFNESVRRLLGVDNYSYEPKRKGAKDKPLWAAREEKAQQAEARIAFAEKALKSIETRFIFAKQEIKKWGADFLKELAELAKPKAKKVARHIDGIEDISPATAEIADEIVEAIEEQKPNAPDEIKVSSKRKRRRRKRT